MSQKPFFPLRITNHGKCGTGQQDTMCVNQNTYTLISIEHNCQGSSLLAVKYLMRRFNYSLIWCNLVNCIGQYRHKQARIYFNVKLLKEMEFAGFVMNRS